MAPLQGANKHEYRNGWLYTGYKEYEKELHEKQAESKDIKKH